MLRRAGSLACLILLFSCASAPEQPAEDAPGAAGSPVFSGEPEEVSGRLDVYASIARAVKYNVDAAAADMRGKLAGDQGNPLDALARAREPKGMEENRLFGAIRGLNYAIAYATAAEGNLYEKAAESLALGAIKSHKDALYGIRASRDIARQFGRDRKVLAALNERLDKDGRLSADDQYLLKALEVAALRQDREIAALGRGVAAYSALVKTKEPADKLELEGKAFFELEDFDKRFTVEAFQRAAYANRAELEAAANKPSFDEARRRMFKLYPQVERLNANDYNVASNPPYAKDLAERAKDAAERLVEAGYNARLNPGDADDAGRLADGLCAAVLIQAETAFNLIRLAEADAAAIDAEIKALNKEIKRLAAGEGKSADRKVDHINARIKLMELEARRSEILGERAVAIRTMYFTVGFAPFARDLLKSDLREMARRLKAGFTEDAAKMLSGSPVGGEASVAADEPVAAAPAFAKGAAGGAAGIAAPAMSASLSDSGKDWAKGEDWLAALVEKESVARGPLSAVRKAGTGRELPAYEGAEADGRKVMQVGAYIEPSNADKDWAELSKRHPALANYQHRIETAEVGGTLFHRLVVVSPSGGLRDLCNSLRAENTECFLR